MEFSGFDCKIIGFHWTSSSSWLLKLQERRQHLVAKLRGRKEQREQQLQELTEEQEAVPLPKT